MYIFDFLIHANSMFIVHFIYLLYVVVIVVLLIIVGALIRVLWDTRKQEE